MVRINLTLPAEDGELVLQAVEKMVNQIRHSRQPEDATANKIVSAETASNNVSAETKSENVSAETFVENDAQRMNARLKLVTSE